MIGTFETAFVGGIIFSAVAWLLQKRLRAGLLTNDGRENKETEKDAIADLVVIMKEHDIEELEINDSGFRIKRR